MGTPANPPPQPTVTVQPPPPGWSIPAKYKTRAGWIALGVILLYVLFSHRGEAPAKPAAPPPPKVGAKVPHDLETAPRVERGLSQAEVEREREAYWRRLREAQMLPPGVPPTPVPGMPSYHQPPPQDPQATAREEARRVREAREEERRKAEEKALRANQVVFSDPVPKAEAALVRTVADEDRPPAVTRPATAPVAEAAPDEAGKYTLFEGHIISTFLVNRINASFTGPFVTQVTTHVYSRPTSGSRLLIPAGSRFIGSAEKVMDAGQVRVAVPIHRVILPNEESYKLEIDTGLSQSGEAAITGKVNRHYLQTFGLAGALALVAGFSLYNTQGGYGYYESGADAYRRGVGMSLGMSAMQILGKYLNMPWTVTVEPGTEVVIMLTADLKLPEYREKVQ